MLLETDPLMPATTSQAESQAAKLDHDNLPAESRVLSLWMNPRRTKHRGLEEANFNSAARVHEYCLQSLNQG